MGLEFSQSGRPVGFGRIYILKSGAKLDRFQRKLLHLHKHLFTTTKVRRGDNNLSIMVSTYIDITI